MNIFRLLHQFNHECRGNNSHEMSRIEMLKAAVAAYFIRRVWLWLPGPWRSTIAVFEFRRQSPPDAWVTLLPMRTITVHVHGDRTMLTMDDAMSLRGNAPQTELAITLESLH